MKPVDKKDKKRSPEDYLAEPYSRIIIPDKETGTYAAEMLEFPGCITQGSTVQEAHERLEETALSWIQAALDLGQGIPPPASVNEYSGRIALRLPRSLHRLAALAAGREGTSLNQFIVMAVSESVGACRVPKIGLQRLDKPCNITADAVEVNPKRESSRRKQ